QRFRFCGDLDCPDWVLAEISTLAKILKCPPPACCGPAAPPPSPPQSSVKPNLICAPLLRDLLGEATDYDKTLKLTSDAKLGDHCCSYHHAPMEPSSRDGQQCIGEYLAKGTELTLPPVCRVRGCEGDFILSSAAKHDVDSESLPMSQLGSVRWRVDYTLSSSELQEVNEPVVHLTFNVRDRESDKMTAVPVTLSANKFWVLLA
ncbi:COMD4 protein, partial [Buphagus erythrorhynchus]|nr:COMD4 protein [Buphagus erythrorhynchus]